MPALVFAAFGADAGLCEQPETAQPEHRVLVLYDGRVVRGKMRPVIDGFIVEQGDTETHIPLRQVRVAADSLSRAYQRLRTTMPEAVASSHLALARWCLTNGLLEESRFELLEVLRLDAQNPVARSMLQKLDAVLSQREVPTRDAPDSPNGRDQETIPSKLPAASLPPAASIVSRDAMRRFVRQIQPLLLNRCGNARCHGSATAGSFLLANVPRSTGGYRISSQRNLKQVLGYIDVSTPRQSPLLVWASREHGPARHRTHAAPLSKAQLEALGAWVEAVAGEPGEESTSPSVGPGGLNGFPANSGSAATTQPDPFDPEEFNRRFGAPKADRDGAAR